jgi:Zn-dependent protease
LNLIGINTTLIIFNLIPIPPLDGSHVAESLLGRHLPHQVFAFLRQYGRYILLALLWLGILDYPISWAQNLVFGLISKLLVA